MKTNEVSHSFWSITREQAIAMGLTYEGTSGGVPIFAREVDGELDIICKCPALEWLLSLQLFAIQLGNSFRDPDDAVPFGFRIRAIDGSGFPEPKSDVGEYEL